MTENLPPTTVGSAGLTGRPQIVRLPDALDEPDGYDEHGNPIWDEPRAPGKAMPPNCLRVLNSPLPVERQGGCSLDCPGLQRDGSCLCDIVRAANEQGVDWKFEIDRDNYWVYEGPPLAAYTPPEPFAEPELPIPTFNCPHCGETNEQSHSNFHYWCLHCGKNAKDA